jgi:hypothetical protein
VSNGDEAFDSIDELRAYYETYLQPGALAIQRTNRGDARWNDLWKVSLSYCVSTAFGSNHATVVQAMRAAAAAWESAGNLRYEYRPSEDGRCDGSNPYTVFDVRPLNGDKRILARAFFPNDRRIARNVLINGSAFTVQPPYTLEGILRHELGHTLGFRHEHTRPEAGACYEDGTWRAITAYDPYSVMHYPQCNGKARDFQLSAGDQAGVAAIYGAPTGG